MNEQVSKRKVAGSLIWKTLEKIFVQGVNLLVQIVLARILLPDDFGNLAIIVAITNYAAIFVQSGISTAIIQRKDINGKDISTLFLSSMGFALLLYVILFFASPLISSIYKTDQLIWPLRVLSLILFLNSINAVQTGIYSRNMEFKKIFLRSIIAVPVSGMVGILLAIGGYGIWSLVVHNLLNMFIIVIVMAFDRKIWFKISFSISSFKKMYSFTGKIILTGIITGGGDLIRTLLIGKKYSSEDLAYYDKAYTYSGYATQIVGQSISSVMIAPFSRLQDDKEELKKMARKSIVASAFVMFPILLGIASVAKPLIIVLLTDKWLPSYQFLMLFCVLRMPSFISNVDKHVYYALGKSEINLFYEIAYLIFNIGVLFFTIQLGTIYIALGVTLAEWIGCFILFLISYKTYGYSFLERFKDLWKPLLNSCVVFLASYFIGMINLNIYIKLFIQIIMGVLAYFLMIFLTKDKTYVSIINLFKKRRRYKE